MSLSKATILMAFKSLARELAANDQSAEIAIMGGAAMLLVHDARPSTKDVDAVVTHGTARAVRDAASTVATELGLPPDWLNDGAKGFLNGLAAGAVVFSEASLIVRAIADQQLLAMKLSAWRDRIDGEDATLLLARIVGTKQEVWLSIEPHLVQGREQTARYAYDDLWDNLHGSS